MRSLQAIVMIIALLGQVVPLQAWAASSEPAACQMSCCAAVDAACQCSSKSDAPAQPAPAQTPPAKGRDLAPQVWMIVALGGVVLPGKAEAVEGSAQELAKHRLHALPKTRLNVLFCSFLN